MTKKANAAGQANENGDLGMGLLGLSKSVESVAEELQPLYKIEELNEGLRDMAYGLGKLAHAVELGIIAAYGTEEDREKAVDYLKKSHEALVNFGD